MNKPKLKELGEGLAGVSLGISIVVAILIGVGVGYLLKNLTGIAWLFWLGVFWGVAAAILNVYKAYKRAQREFEKLASDPKYANKPKDSN